MGSIVLSGLFSLCGVCITGLFGYLINRRVQNGTTAADTLLEESKAMREELRNEVSTLQARVAARDEEIAGLRADLEALRTGVIAAGVALPAETPAANG